MVAPSRKSSKRSMLGMSLGIGMRLINQVTVLPRQDTSESAYRIDRGRAAGKYLSKVCSYPTSKT